jgi:hypothetical protein
VCLSHYLPLPRRYGRIARRFCFILCLVIWRAAQHEIRKKVSTHTTCSDKHTQLTTFLSLPRNQVPEWAASYINYKGLKKLVKAAAEKAKNGEKVDPAGGRL